MVKKKLNILLLLSLVLLSLSLLGTTSYAREFTQTEIKNFMNNYVDNFYDGTNYKTLYKQRIANMDLTGWVDGIKGKQGTYLLSAYGSGQYLYFYYFCWRTTNNNYAYLSTQNGSPIITTHDTSIQFRNKFEVHNNTLGYDQSNLFISNTSENLFYYYYVDGVIYTSSNKNEIAYGPNEYKPNETIFDSSYVPTPTQTFTYARSELDSELIDLNNTYWINETAQTVLFKYNPFSGNEINDADAIVVGYVWDADLFEKAIFSRYDYNYATKTFEYSGQYWEKTNIGAVHDNMIWVTFEAKDYGKTLKPDTIIHAEFVPNTTDFSNVHADFYIRSPYTNITNGVLNVDNTFSGDYALIVNDNNNTDKIIDNDNNLYEKMFRISGDKIDEIFTQAMLSIEIESGELAEFEIVKSYLQGEPRRFYYIVEFIYAKFHDI